MSFTGILEEIVERVDGAVSAMVVGIDGMLVEEYTVEKLVSLDELGAESSLMMKNIDEAAKDLGLGKAMEFSIISNNCGIIMRKINTEYYLALIIKPDGNYGKGRYVLRSVIPKIESEF